MNSIQSIKSAGTTNSRPGTSRRSKRRSGKRPALTVGFRRQMNYSASGPGGADATHFRLALRDPFAAGAVGARVVDSFTLPTATYHVRGSIKVTTNVSGDAFFAMLPSPCLTFIQPASNFGGPTISGLVSFSQNVAGPTAPGAAYILSPTQLAYSLTEYRTVSWGVRILAKDTATATKGKVYVAMVPTTDNAPSWNTFETVTGTADAIGEYTIGMSVNSINSVVNLPGVKAFSMQDLLRGEVMLCGTPTNTSFYQFKGTADRSVVAWNTGQVLADEGVYNSSTGLVNPTAGGRKDIASLRGGRAMIIFATGMPASTNELDLEVVFHLEGTPNVVGAGTTNALVPSAMRPALGSTNLVEKIVSVASTANELFKYLRDPLVTSSGMKALSFLGL